MSFKHIANGPRGTGSRSAMEALGEHAVLEEQGGIGDGDSEVIAVFLQRVATVGKEGEGERGLGVGGEEAGSGEVELGVRGD